MSEVSDKREEILYLEKYAILDIETATAEHKLFHELGGALSKDGDSFCALIGADLQEGCSGFGKTRLLAVRDCIHNYWNNNE